jgi:outer membrane protein OmpA-like peptidoglycan-associated protein
VRLAGPARPLIGVNHVSHQQRAHPQDDIGRPAIQAQEHGAAADANSVLRHLAQQALSYHLRVSLTGYASPNGGTSEYNYTLLERRAAAVRDRLITFGVPARKITAAGRGAASQSMGSCKAQGHRHPDESGCELLRRVDIVLVP